MDTLRVVGNAIGGMPADPTNRAAGSRSRSDAIAGPLALLGAAALANLLLQGFEFPRYNNIFHVAIVLDYAGSAEGPHDLFHQTLGAFVSALWPLLARVATEENIFALFFTVYALNRAALLLFLYLAAAEISLRPGYALAAAVGVAVLMLWPAWSLSPLAYNDTFVRSLSQTELAVTALVACLWLMLRRQWTWTAVLLGLIFNVSAFMAVWGMAVAAAAYLWTNRAAPGSRSRASCCCWP